MLNILVGEDDRMIAHLVCSILRRQGWIANSARDVDTIIGVMNETPGPDALVIDMHLVGGTAADVMRALDTSPTRPLPPVILLSGAGAEQLGELATSRRIFAILSKPVDPPELVRTVAAAVQDRDVAERT